MRDCVPYPDEGKMRGLPAGTKSDVEHEFSADEMKQILDNLMIDLSPISLERTATNEVATT